MPTLDWIGKNAVENHDKEIPYRLIKCEETIGDQESGNLIVQGDNLEALKALLPYYAGKIRCIYIDPPYNIGNEGWAYNDNVNSPEIREWLHKVVGKEGEDLSRHDKWLCMMYPRLQLLRRFLKNEGVIFISIDENEEHRLRILCDEIFGINHFVEKVIWNKRVPKNDKGIGNIHEYILLYVNNNSIRHEFYMPKDGLDEVYEFVEKLKKKKKSISESEDELKKFYNKKGYDRGITLYCNLDENYKIWGKINVSWPNAKNGPRYDVIHPKTNKPTRVPDNGWRYTETTFKGYLDYSNVIERFDGSFVCGKMWFAQDEKTQPSYIQYLDNVKELLFRSIISLKSSGGSELDEILPNHGFPHPKTYNLIRKLLHTVDEENLMVLDSFAGSGTTAHSVLQLNKEDGGKRKFILIELDEKICREVTTERVKRVINGYEVAKPNGTKGIVKGLGGGFKFCKLGEPLFDEFGNIRQDVKFNELAYHIFFSETGTPLDKNPQNTKIGVFHGVAYYLLFNGILGDKSINGGNILTSKVLGKLPKHQGKKVIFGEGCRLGSQRLRKENINFKQLPYEIKVN